ncbi:MAG: cyclic nucleotide-binding domain-containing protein [Deltaproteobacteria bacterium]|nr:cyclic nucleotide-binding domain-containing protein [Candidatus Anaeroferrophillacea bacterium]
MAAIFFGRKDHREEDSAGRVARLREQLARSPNSFHLRVKLAESLLQGGDRRRGIAMLVQMVDQETRRGSSDKAIALCKLILRHDRENVRAREVLAGMLSNRGLNADAAEFSGAPKDAAPETDDAALAVNVRLGVEEMRQLAETAPPQSVAACEEVVRQGESGDTFYVVAAGQLGVFRTGDDRQERMIAELGPGNFFGEMSVYGGGVRSATVRALTVARVLPISSGRLEELGARLPAFKEVLDDAFRKRQIDAVLSSLMFFHQFAVSRRLEIIEQLLTVPVAAGDEIVHEGQHNRRLYIILAGRMDVWLRDRERRVRLATLAVGDFFGEISMITGRPAIATVIAATDGMLAIMDRRLLDEIATRFPHFLRTILDRLKQRNQQTMHQLLGGYERED